MPLVTARVRLKDWRGEPGPATVHARLLDTSWIDAPARTVDEVLIYDVRLDEIEEQGLSFALVAQEVDPRARYEVSVLVDLDGDGKTSIGDYRNTRSYPVLTHGFSDEAEVVVHRIG